MAVIRTGPEPLLFSTSLYFIFRRASRADSVHFSALRPVDIFLQPNSSDRKSLASSSIHCSHDGRPKQLCSFVPSDQIGQQIDRVALQPLPLRSTPRYL